MRKVINHFARIERKHLIAACAIVVGLAIIVIVTTSMLVASTQAPPTKTAISISGEIVCLPHKNSGGPQTLECAIGLHADDNRYFALQYGTLPPNNTGERVAIRGMLTTGEDTIYATSGSIAVESVAH